MKKILSISLITGLFFAANGSIADTDYSDTSNDKFFKAQEKVRTMTPKDQQAYRMERQERLKGMDQEKRPLMKKSQHQNTAKDSSNKKQLRLRDASGASQQRGKMNAQGGGKGR